MGVCGRYRRGLHIYPCTGLIGGAPREALPVAYCCPASRCLDSLSIREDHDELRSPVFYQSSGRTGVRSHPERTISVYANVLNTVSGVWAGSGWAHKWALAMLELQGYILLRILRELPRGLGCCCGNHNIETCLFCIPPPHRCINILTRTEYTVMLNSCQYRPGCLWKYLVESLPTIICSTFSPFMGVEKMSAEKRSHTCAISTRFTVQATTSVCAWSGMMFYFILRFVIASKTFFFFLDTFATASLTGHTCLLPRSRTRDGGVERKLLRYPRSRHVCVL